MNEERLVVGARNQVRCPACNSWHFAINVDEQNNVIEFKCCRQVCGRIYKYAPKLNITQDAGDVEHGE
jgi:hypothetical protein